MACSAQAVRLLAQEDARREIEVSLKLLIRVINAVNPAILRKKGNEPWLYFYEDFLRPTMPSCARITVSTTHRMK